MTMYSVWDYGKQTYEYYQAPGDGATHAGSPKKTLIKSSLGATPEQAAWKLPPGAQHVGSGPMPKGRIASVGQAPSLGDIDMSSVTPVAIVAGLAYLAWRSIK